MRYVPHTDEDRAAMLGAIGVATMEDLLTPIPAELRAPDSMDAFPEALAEADLKRFMSEMAAENTPLSARPSFLGAGCYRHAVPAIVDSIASRGEILTAYTPYQAEASQGTLQTIFEFQTMVAELADMPLTNASLYDGATALVEGILMVLATRGDQKAEGRDLVLLSKGIHPEYRATVRTYLHALPYRIEEVDLDAQGQTSRDALAAKLSQAAVFAFQSPSFPGTIEDAAALCAMVKASGAKVIQVFDPLAASIITPPGEAGADVAVGDGQCLGNYASFGGPHLGLFAAQQEFIRRLPGRVVGKTVDLDGRTAYVLTLQTREQHIRRERATSNICTNVGLIATRATIFLAAMGKEGLRDLAITCLERAHYAAEKIAALKGFSLRYPKTPFFREVAITCPIPAADVNRRLDARGITGGFDLGRVSASETRTMLFCFSEVTSRSDIERLVAALAEIGGAA